MRTHAKGQILPIVMISLVVLSIIIYAMVTWIQNDSRWSVKQSKTTSAINLAEAAIDRAQWKLQSTTTTWATVAAGGAVPGGGYNFDKTYTDIPGGSYRIKVTAIGDNSVTIVGEGRDDSTKEVRALSTVFKNETIYSAMMSGGNVSWAKGLGVFWGPIIAQGNITLQDDVVAAWYYPRKYAKGTVVGTAANPRDTNGINPPNTDNVEWWSEYAGVPSVPVLDFTSMRSSAAATGTLNIYGCKNSSFHGATVGTPDQGGTAGAAPWDRRASCSISAGDSAPHNQHFGNSMSYVQTFLDTTKDYVWYWDHDVALEGAFCGAIPCTPGQSTGLRGTVVVRGDLTVDSPGDLIYTGRVPANAWQEENKLTKTTFDTNAVGEYPADIGLHTSTGIFNFGGDTFCIPITGCGEYTTVGVRGFTYVGGDLTIASYMDFNGALWVNGSVTAINGSAGKFCGIFYDDALNVPALNVILIRQSWQEIAASPTAWP